MDFRNAGWDLFLPGDHGDIEVAAYFHYEARTSGSDWKKGIARLKDSGISDPTEDQKRIEAYYVYCERTEAFRKESREEAHREVSKEYRVRLAA
jgi:hypothetical protein